MADDFQFPSNPSIVENIKNRYAKDMIYTNAGDALVSVNPYKTVTTDDKTNANIYDFAYMLKCRNRPSQAVLNTQTKAKSIQLRVPPHPFILADEAYESLHSNRHSQTIVIQGVGGTGKSENAKLIVNYLVNLKSLSESPPLPEPKKKRLPSGPLGMAENPFVLGPEITQFDKVLLAAISTVESFSSAKTATNDNSSRVGKFLKIYFGSSFDVAGAQFSTYMLEKVRRGARIFSNSAILLAPWFLTPLIASLFLPPPSPHSPASPTSPQRRGPSTSSTSSYSEARTP